MFDSKKKGKMSHKLGQRKYTFLVTILNIIIVVKISKKELIMLKPNTLYGPKQDFTSFNLKTFF